MKKFIITGLLALASLLSYSQTSHLDSTSMYFPSTDSYHTTIYNGDTTTFYRADTVYATHIRHADTLYYYRGFDELTDYEVYKGTVKEQYNVLNGTPTLTGVYTKYYSTLSEASTEVIDYTDSAYLKAYNADLYFETIQTIDTMEVYTIDGSFLFKFIPYEDGVTVGSGYFIKVKYE